MGEVFSLIEANSLIKTFGFTAEYKKMQYIEESDVSKREIKETGSGLFAFLGVNNNKFNKIGNFEEDISSSVISTIQLNISDIIVYNSISYLINGIIDYEDLGNLFIYTVNKEEGNIVYG